MPVRLVPALMSAFASVVVIFPLPSPGEHRPDETSMGSRKPASARFSKRQVDALAAQNGVLGVGKRGYAVKEQPRRPAPHDDVAMSQPKFLGLVATLQASEQENGRYPQRHRDDRRSEILFVSVLMQRHAGTRRVAVDQAGIGRKVREAGFRRRLARQLAKYRRYRRPLRAGIGIDVVV